MLREEMVEGRKEMDEVIILEMRKTSQAPLQVLAEVPPQILAQVVFSFPFKPPFKPPLKP